MHPTLGSGEHVQQCGIDWLSRPAASGQHHDNPLCAFVFGKTIKELFPARLSCRTVPRHGIYVYRCGTPCQAFQAEKLSAVSGSCESCVGCIDLLPIQSAT